MTADEDAMNEWFEQDGAILERGDEKVKFAYLSGYAEGRHAVEQLAEADQIKRLRAAEGVLRKFSYISDWCIDSRDPAQAYLLWQELRSALAASDPAA